MNIKNAGSLEMDLWNLQLRVFTANWKRTQDFNLSITLVNDNLFVHLKINLV